MTNDDWPDCILFSCQSDAGSLPNVSFQIVVTKAEFYKHETGRIRLKRGKQAIRSDLLQSAALVPSFPYRLLTYLVDCSKRKKDK